MPQGYNYALCTTLGLAVKAQPCKVTVKSKDPSRPAGFAIRQINQPIQDNCDFWQGCHVRSLVVASLRDSLNMSDGALQDVIVVLAHCAPSP